MLADCLWELKQKGTTYFSFLVLRAHTLSFQNCVLAVQKKVTKTFYAMAFPVFHKHLEFLDGFDTLLASNCIVGTCKYGRSSLDTF